MCREPDLCAAAPSFGEQNVEAECPDAIVIEQNVDNVCQSVSRPGPLAELQLACLVYVDDDDAFVDTTGHRGTHTNVVEVILHAVDDLKAGTGSNVQREDDEDNRADRNPRQHSDCTSGEQHGDNLHDIATNSPQIQYKHLAACRTLFGWWVY